MQGVAVTAHTEAEAKKKTCPIMGEMDGGVNTRYHKCQASNCMLWVLQDGIGMKLLFIILYFTLVLAAVVHAQESEPEGQVPYDTEIYGGNGAYIGRIDDKGEMFDKLGHYNGYINKDGEVYDKLSHYKGTIITKKVK